MFQPLYWVCNICKVTMTVTLSGCEATSQESVVTQRKYDKLQRWNEVKKEIKEVLGSHHDEQMRNISIPCGPQVCYK